jgi:peptidoglycan/xylan/chitin deacetylase (PgdA/CDA1 family)
VLDLKPSLPYPFDEGVVDAAPDEFERHIQTIRTYFTPIGIDDAIRATDGAPLPPNPILVTFDDGYRDNYDIAFPILKKYGVRAVFFIATHYINARRVFWWDRASFIMKTTKRVRIALSYPKHLTLDLATPAQREYATRAVLRVIKSHRGLDLERYLEHLAEVANVPWNAELDGLLANSMLMTWDHIRHLRSHGMDIQSHTRTHRVLQTLDATQLRSEIHGSRHDLQEQLGDCVTAISYPVGYRVVNSVDVRQELEHPPYKIGVTNGLGTHRLGGADRYDVSRIGMRFSTPESLFRAMLAAPQLFG